MVKINSSVPSLQNRRQQKRLKPCTIRLPNQPNAAKATAGWIDLGLTPGIDAGNRYEFAVGWLHRLTYKILILLDQYAFMIAEYDPDRKPNC